MLTTLLLAALAGEHAKTHAGCKEPIALVDWAASDLLTLVRVRRCLQNRSEMNTKACQAWCGKRLRLDLPPATSALRASMQVANPRWKFHLVDDPARRTFIGHRTALSPGLTCWPCHSSLLCGSVLVHQCPPRRHPRRPLQLYSTLGRDRLTRCRWRCAGRPPPGRGRSPAPPRAPAA